MSLLPDSRIDHVPRNVGEGLAGKDGAVLVIDLTPSGRSFMALKGGIKFQYTHAISLAVDCLG
jgi:predicted 3-demethylubiquinone-9 3-methyltransferase (glyoxalase superfamily)